MANFAKLKATKGGPPSLQNREAVLELSFPPPSKRNHECPVASRARSHDQDIGADGAIGFCQR
jgi:hypothetical protein